MENLREEQEIKDLISKGFLATMRDNYSGLIRVIEELELLIGYDEISREKSNEILQSWLIDFNYYQFIKNDLTGFMEQFCEVLLQLAIKVNSYKSADTLMQILKLEDDVFLDPYIILAIKSGSRECLDLLVQYLDTPNSMLILERTDVLTVALALGRHDIAESLSNEYSYGRIDELPRQGSGYYISMTEQISSLTYIIQSKVLDDLEALAMVRLSFERYGGKIEGIDQSVVHDRPIVSAVKRGSLPVMDYFLLHLDHDRVDWMELMTTTIASHSSLFKSIEILDLLLEKSGIAVEGLNEHSKDLIQAVLKESKYPVELLKYFIKKGMSIQSITDTCLQTDHQHISDKLIQERYS
jgi:hypothetical protein